MDDKLLGHMQILGAAAIGIGYFLPWGSVMSPFGPIELRGIYVDYAWILLILAILHLGLQFARSHKDALGIADRPQRYMEIIGRVVPLVFVAFFSWYGARFIFAAHFALSGKQVSIFGTSMDSVVRAGLDYGFWIGASGAVLLLVSVGLLNRQAQRFFVYAGMIAVAAAGLAVGFSQPGKAVRRNMSGEPSNGLAAITNGSSTGASVPQPAFDSSPFVRLSSISAKALAKDYDAGRFSNSIVIYPVFKNVGNQTIVGLKGYLSVIDGFGNEVYGFKFRDDDKILPGHDSGQGGYSFEDNQFMSNDPYHKMLPLVIAGTARYKVRITQVAFQDGTVLPKKQ